MESAVKWQDVWLDKRAFLWPVICIGAIEPPIGHHWSVYQHWLNIKISAYLRDNTLVGQEVQKWVTKYFHYIFSTWTLVGTKDYIQLAVKLDCNFSFLCAFCICRECENWYTQLGQTGMKISMRKLWTPWWARMKFRWEGFGTLHCCLYKVSRPNSVTYLERKPIFGWCVFRCKSKKEHQKDMCCKEIAQCAQDLWTIRGSYLA